MTRAPGGLHIRTTGSRWDTGLGRRLSAREEVDENPYAIGNLHPPIIVNIGGFHTARRGVPQEEKGEYCNSISQVDKTIIVGVSPVEEGREETLIRNTVFIRIGGSTGGDITLIRDPVFITVITLSPAADISVIPDPVSIAVVAGMPGDGRLGIDQRKIQSCSFIENLDSRFRGQVVKLCGRDRRIHLAQKTVEARDMRNRHRAA